MCCDCFRPYCQACLIPFGEPDVESVCSSCHQNLQQRQPTDVPLAFEAELHGRVRKWLDERVFTATELRTDDTCILTLLKSRVWHPQDRRPPNMNETRGLLVERIYLRPRYRRQHVSTRLMRFLQQEVQARSLTYLCIHDAITEASRALARSLGYVQRPHSEDFIWYNDAALPQ